MSITCNSFHWNCSICVILRPRESKDPHCKLLFWPLYRAFCCTVSLLITVNVTAVYSLFCTEKSPLCQLLLLLSSSKIIEACMQPVIQHVCNQHMFKRTSSLNFDCIFCTLFNVGDTAFVWNYILAWLCLKLKWLNYATKCNCGCRNYINFTY